MVQPITKVSLNKVISGVIKDSIRTHGDITPQTMSSFSKRLTGEMTAVLRRAGFEVN